jgi:anti-anti-sigma regulatory factor
MTADLKVTGRFDGVFVARTMPMLEKLAQERRDVTVDLSKASAIDGAGLQALVNLHKGLAPQGFAVRVAGAGAKLIATFERYHVADLFIEGAPVKGNSALRTVYFGLLPGTTAGAAAGTSPEARKSTGEGGPRARLKQAAPAPVRFNAASHSVKLWLDGATARTPGAELRGGEALKSYRRWASKVLQDVDAAEFRKHLAAILGPGCIVPRASGYIVKGIQLRGCAARGTKKTEAAIRMRRGQFAEPSRADAIAALSF